jgi:hypothetical protein
VRHQDETIPPCDSGSETSSMAASEARNGQENGRMATPTVSETVGDSSRQAARVRVTADRNATQGGGLASPCGQASRISAAFSADRTRITAPRSRANSNHGWLYPKSQRRSWNTASGGTAVSCPASDRAEGATQHSSAASAMTAPEDSAIRPRWARNSRPDRDPAASFMSFARLPRVPSSAPHSSDPS